MNLYRFKVHCNVCGGEGAASAETSAASWYEGSFIAHDDPRVCAENLARRKRELEQREAALKKKEDKFKG
jgi:hypothetical protein